MNEYEIAYTPDLRCYPNYSLAVGDIDGDGRMELVSLNQNGNRLRAVALEGRVVFERKINNNGNWGTPLICLADLDGDGRHEIIVPCPMGDGVARIAAFNGAGEELAAYSFGSRCRDAYGIRVPLLASPRMGSRPGIVAAVAGGQVVLLDHELKEVWRADGFRRDFGHEFYLDDIDNDGSDEIAFCTVDSRGGEFVLLDHDGAVMLRKNVAEYYADDHFDDVAMADFRGMGSREILFEKGMLIDQSGSVVWDRSSQFDHGQWIAHAPDPRGGGRLIFIAELWGDRGKSALFSPHGELIREVSDLPGTVLDKSQYPGWRVLPTRCHIVQWTPDSVPEIFLGEQACSPTSSDCFATTRFDLRAFFLDLQGNLLGVLPFPDAQVEGYWYNGEVHSQVADVDGDGVMEVVFPRQDGKVMIIRKKGR